MNPGMKCRIWFSLLIFLILPIITGCNEKSTKDKVESKINDRTLSNKPNQEESKSEEERKIALLVSKDFGSTWEDAGQGLPNDLQVSFLEKMGNEIVVASDNKGIFISYDHNAKWKQIGENLPNQKINALHIFYQSIYVGVYNEGIYHTSDKGLSWQSLNFDLPNRNVQAVWAGNHQLIVGTDDGIFKKAIGKKNWKPTSITDQVLSLYGYDGKLIAGTSLGTAISHDVGDSWSWIRKKGAVHYTHHIGQRIIELALNGDLAYSDDWGQTWRLAEYEPRKGSYIYEIAEVGSYQLLSNNYGIHRSKDNGKNWEHIYHTESMGFFDLLVIGDHIYGGTRSWDEYRKRRLNN